MAFCTSVLSLSPPRLVGLFFLENSLPREEFSSRRENPIYRPFSRYNPAKLPGQMFTRASSASFLLPSRFLFSSLSFPPLRHPPLRSRATGNSRECAKPPSRAEHCSTRIFSNPFPCLLIIDERIDARTRPSAAQTFEGLCRPRRLFRPLFFRQGWLAEKENGAACARARYIPA